MTDAIENAKQYLERMSTFPGKNDCLDHLAAVIETAEAGRVALAALNEILTDPVNQLEQTKGGYYIYRFDLETMHRIADALGIESAPTQPTLSYYTPNELTKLIR